jgi:iduronate 2-sulfatase
VMKNPKLSVKEFSVSQYPRSSDGVETERQGYAAPKVMGYSLRTSQYRYTVWMKDGFKSDQPYKEDLLIGAELYDYKSDPEERVNVADDKKYAVVSKDMKQKMLGYFKSQVK